MAPTPPDTTCTAFEGSRLIATGPLPEVALKVKEVMDRGETAPVLIFDDETSRLVEFDWRGTPKEVLERLSPKDSKRRCSKFAIAWFLWGVGV